jgi:hypothetical protein
MDTSMTREILIATLQTALVGNLKLTSNVNPQNLADAIITKLNFNKTSVENTNDKMAIVLISIVKGLKDEMKDELKSLSENEKLLKNFVHGKITAYEEMLNTLKTY